MPFHVTLIVFLHNERKTFAVIAHHGFQPVFKTWVVNPRLWQFAFTHFLIELVNNWGEKAENGGGVAIATSDANSNSCSVQVLLAPYTVFLGSMKLKYVKKKNWNS